ncbi:MOSC domain-containing protein [Cognatishimia sp. F0-27]|uniref:MOSC domain-containing protein n=1 Tax=Cognatishimia sp. F0-27 TaxID=2816855 RepID=UPI001D0C66C8|nr:MOSC domain-containing protein [Cognatishimia sp. F0-27]MCC1493911.1 MOSC domain-containing protein [Cognatishimia sp. F0-27]
MPALKKTPFGAEVTWLGRVDPRDKLCSTALQSLVLDWDGPVGAKHSGRTRPSCSRVTAQHAKGTEIANTRQLSLISAEDLAQIAAAIGLEALDPALLGASVVLEGLEDFTFLPPSSRLQGPDGLTLVVDMENRPCVLPGREIDARHPGHGAAFKAAARHRRGVTAWVERPGTLRLGDRVTLHVPDQRAWRGGA